MEYEKHFLKCAVCKKEILLEMHQIGISHIASLIVTCKNCLDVSVVKANIKFKEKNPTQYEEIIKWLKK